MQLIHSVQNRILFIPSKFDLCLGEERIIELLKGQEIHLVKTNSSVLAGSLVGKSRWKWAARQWEAPEMFDCSSFTKWIWGQSGLWLPRRPKQQFRFFLERGWIRAFCGSSCLEPGDLLFATSPYVNGKFDPEHATTELRHMLIALNHYEVVHATNSDLGTGVVRVSIEKFLEKRTVLAVGKVPKGLTLTFPAKREIESDDDVHHILKLALLKK